MPRVPIRLQEKACKCSKETIPTLKSRLWLADSMQMRTAKEADLHKIKMLLGQIREFVWGGRKNNLHRHFVQCKTMQQADGCTGGGAKTLHSPSLRRAPDHNICHSKHRVYLFYVLLSDLTAAFFQWWFKSIPQLCYRHPRASAAPQRPLLSFSLFWIYLIPGDFSGTPELKSNLKRVKIQGHKWKCN